MEKLFNETLGRRDYIYRDTVIGCFKLTFDGNTEDAILLVMQKHTAVLDENLGIIDVIYHDNSLLHCSPDFDAKGTGFWMVFNAEEVAQDVKIVESGRNPTTKDSKYLDHN